jgi:hypothetical protein
LAMGGLSWRFERIGAFSLWVQCRGRYPSCCSACCRWRARGPVRARCCHARPASTVPFGHVTQCRHKCASRIPRTSSTIHLTETSRSIVIASIGRLRTIRVRQAPQTIVQPPTPVILRHVSQMKRSHWWSTSRLHIRVVCVPRAVGGLSYTHTQRTSVLRTASSERCRLQETSFKLTLQQHRRKGGYVFNCQARPRTTPVVWERDPLPFGALRAQILRQEVEEDQPRVMANHQVDVQMEPDGTDQRLNRLLQSTTVRMCELQRSCGV